MILSLSVMIEMADQRGLCGKRQVLPVQYGPLQAGSFIYPPTVLRVLYVKLANPNEPERTYTITLDSAFWKQRKVAGP